LVRLEAPVYFLADLHLGEAAAPDEAQKLQKLEAFLGEVEAEAKTLVLVGDIFDFWYEWRAVVPKAPFGLLCRLRRLTGAGVQLHYLPGNHDFRLQGFLEREIGAVVYEDAAEFEIGGQKIYAYHGDGILAHDAGYRFWKRVLRSGLNQRLFSWLHPDLGMFLARATSHRSRTAGRYREVDEEEYEAFARGRFSRGFQGVVMGHSHHPRQVEFPNGIYINLGDWIQHFSYGVHDGERLALRYWEADDQPAKELR
jgi:UDP-2,3-diacylglucosamine hydrolase